MAAVPLPPEHYKRRLAIRQVAGRAKRNGWTWVDGINGWRLPDGDYVDLDRLFRSTHPQDFLLETEWKVLPVSQEIPALSEGETT